MKVAVFGANGFLGSSLAHRLLSEGNFVDAFYNARTELIPKGCRLVKSTDAKNLNSNYDVIYVAVGNYSGTHQEFVAQLYQLYSTISQLKYGRLIFVSSVAVYGSHTGIIDRKSSFNDPGLYGMYKISSEFMYSSLPHCSIVRFTYLYGPGMNQNSLIPFWINSAIKDRVINVFGQGEREQDYLYIDDAIELLIALPTIKVTDPLIGASGKSVSNATLAKMIADFIPGTEVKFIKDDKSASFRFNIEETEMLLGWRAKVDLRTGLMATIAAK